MTETTPSAPDKGELYDHRGRFVFMREAVEEDGSVPLSQLADDEIVIWPGHIYRKVS